MLDVGAGKRGELRFSAEEGQVTTFSGRQTSVVKVAGGAPITIALELSQTSTVIDVQSDTFTVEQVIDEIRPVAGEMDPAQVQQIEAEVGAMSGLRSTLVLSTRGELVSNEVDIPEGMDDGSRQFVDQLTSQAAQVTIPLPEEAIGIGGRWDAESSFTVSGVETSQRTIYELRSRRGNVVEIVSTTEIEQTSSVAGVSVSGQGTGTGQITLDLGMPTPRRTRVTLTNTSSLEGEGQAVETSTENTTEFSTERVAD
ncbi:DUF6263 family protein [Nocardioides sp. R-C-SC26]|uniref:DUF6263 family protein n=1 Tax=Nocardioides sp. R-C-SC26 TaxID=2870414 RepID=UPI001E3368FD|nr:DUF6263 family protein [Nocardioides sp. R-C-SC26]